MKKNFSELDKELDKLNDKFKDLDMNFSDLWKKLENRLEKSIRDIDILDNELGGMLADLSSKLVKNGLSELIEGGQLDSFLSPIVNMGNDIFGAIPTNKSTPTKNSKGDAFGMSSSQIFSDLSSALGKISRNS